MGASIREQARCNLRALKDWNLPAQEQVTVRLLWLNLHTTAQGIRASTRTELSITVHWLYSERFSTTDCTQQSILFYFPALIFYQGTCPASSQTRRGASPQHSQSPVGLACSAEEHHDLHAASTAQMCQQKYV